MNAMAAIGALYGKKSIPFLLNGLDDNDPRTVANALEVLGYFKVNELKPYFLQHVDSDVPRVRANALMGLSHYPDTRKLFEKLVRESFQKADVALVGSLLYVIGQSREKTFLPEIMQMYEVPRVRYDPRLVNVLTWSLIRLNDEHGFDLADEILATGDEKHHMAFMHFFSQHDAETRYDIIKYFVTQYGSNPEAIRRAGNLLKNSVYDFHEELQYLKVYSESLSGAGRVEPAPAA